MTNSAIISNYLECFDRLYISFAVQTVIFINRLLQYCIIPNRLNVQYFRRWRCHLHIKLDFFQIIFNIEKLIMPQNVILVLSVFFIGDRFDYSHAVWRGIILEIFIILVVVFGRCVREENVVNHVWSVWRMNGNRWWLCCAIFNFYLLENCKLGRYDLIVGMPSF